MPCPDAPAVPAPTQCGRGRGRRRTTTATASAGLPEAAGGVGRRGGRRSGNCRTGWVGAEAEEERTVACVADWPLEA
jgi:hypothetical protein